jgi:hypothetical protein
MMQPKQQFRVVATALSPARGTLAKVNREIAEAQASVAAANQPINKLNAVAGRLAAAEQKLAASRTADDEQLAAWLEAGRNGPRPMPSHKTLCLEAELVEVRRDRTAAEHALPLRQSEMAQLQEQLGGLAEQQRVAVAAVIVEECERFCQAELRPLLAEFLRREGAVRGLSKVLWTAGQNGLAAQVDAAIASCRPNEAALDLRPGEALLRRLLTDHEATLGIFDERSGR